MHNFRKLFIPVIATLSVTSCGATLRPEVADFIASFSLENCRNSVLKGHYIDKSEGKYKGKDCLFYDEVIFDVTSQENFVYKHVYKTQNYGTISDDDYVEEITKVGDTFVYKKGEMSHEMSYQTAYTYTNRFFYSEYYSQTKRYNGAMYYGDMIKDEAIKQQDFVSIDQEARIYRYKIDKVKSQGSDVVTSIDYSVNHLGMLLSLVDSAYSESDPTTYYNEVITVSY